MQPADGGMPMSARLTFHLSESSKNPISLCPLWLRKPSNKRHFSPTARNLITQAWCWLDKLGPVRFGSVADEFFINVAVAVVPQSYGGMVIKTATPYGCPRDCAR
jgi:hypothetical protein